MTAIQHLDFHGQDLHSWQEAQTDKVYVATIETCRNLGVHHRTQLRRLTPNPLFAAGLATMVIKPMDRSRREVVGRDLELLPMRLATIPPPRVAVELRDTLLLYPRECAKALRDDWFTGKAEQ